jgi:hypothetical protein
MCLVGVKSFISTSGEMGVEVRHCHDILGMRIEHRSVSQSDVHEVILEGGSTPPGGLRRGCGRGTFLWPMVMLYSEMRSWRDS